MVDTNKDRWKGRVQELLEKDALEDNQRESLESMIDSPDEENFVLAKELLRLKISDTLVEGLNSGQAKAYTQIIDYFRTLSHDGVVLKGYAGTGKTYLVKRIIEYITVAHPSHRIAITAPTNKAVHVLHRNSPFYDNTSVFEDYGRPSDKIVYCTIHKLLNLREEITADGKQKFVSDSFKKGSTITDYNYIIVDEVSMLDDSLFTELIKYKDKVKFVFMGDPAQIPPVNRLDCLPFSKSCPVDLLQLELTEIMRQKGDHPIIEAGVTLRSNLKVEQPLGKPITKINSQGNGIVHVDAKTNRKQARVIIEKFISSPEYQANIDYFKMIAWTNNTVRGLNKIARNILFGDIHDKFIVGERLVANKALFERKPGYKNSDMKFYQTKATTSDEFTVDSVEVKPLRFKEDLGIATNEDQGLSLFETSSVIDITLDFWVMKTRFKNNDLTLYVIHENSEAEYNQLLNKLKDAARKKKNPMLWIAYYTVKKWSDDVMYNYAITAHKSQGSTYTNVLLIEEDLDHNRKVFERNRIKYTAYTRATDRLYILK